jgi:hypothetical protein
LPREGVAELLPRPALSADLVSAIGGENVLAGLPMVRRSIWYDKANLWVRGEFARDGSKVQYQLDA